MEKFMNNDKIKNFFMDNLLEDPTGGAQTLSTFTFFCPFCVS